FHANAIRLSVKADKVVDDLAKFVLRPNDGRISQLGNSLALFPDGRTWQPVENLSGWPLAIWESVAPPTLPVGPVDQGAEPDARFQMWQERLQCGRGIGFPPGWKF